MTVSILEQILTTFVIGKDCISINRNFGLYYIITVTNFDLDIMLACKRELLGILSDLRNVQKIRISNYFVVYQCQTNILLQLKDILQQAIVEASFSL